jgi:hypothetical protein
VTRWLLALFAVALVVLGTIFLLRSALFVADMMTDDAWLTTTTVTP